MSEKELFEHITSKLKWYIGYCSASNATQLKQRYKVGGVKPETIEKLFKHFGYEKKREAVWGKKEEPFTGGIKYRQS